MKNIMVTLCLIGIFSPAFTQNLSSYRIYGEILTVENVTHRGYITWNQYKNFWIDFFEASKPENAYSLYFKQSDGIIFRTNDREGTTPPAHGFCCRFGNIKTIRLTGPNQILLQLKNGEELLLVKGSYSDINTDIQITTPTETIPVEWDHISEIHFMQADTNTTVPVNHQVAGIVKSSQGIYKGLIYWNYNKNYKREEVEKINHYLSKLQRIMIKKRIQGGNEVFGLLLTGKNPKERYYRNPFFLSSMENIMINMPNIGSVFVPWRHFKELTIVPLSELNLLSYDDFKMPQAIKGEVITRKNQIFSGRLAYDLDETYDFEVLDGRNNTISYRIPFRYICSIEPKNYKYSFITLRNGGEISLGETCDVNQENNGIIIFNENQNPVYVQWSEVKKITLR